MTVYDPDTNTDVLLFVFNNFVPAEYQNCLRVAIKKKLVEAYNQGAKSSVSETPNNLNLLLDAYRFVFDRMVLQDKALLQNLKERRPAMFALIWNDHVDDVDDGDTLPQ